MRGIAPHLSMKPKASSKKDLKRFKGFKRLYTRHGNVYGRLGGMTTGRKRAFLGQKRGFEAFWGDYTIFLLTFLSSRLIL